MRHGRDNRLNAGSLLTLLPLESQPQRQAVPQGRGQKANFPARAEWGSAEWLPAGLKSETLHHTV